VTRYDLIGDDDMSIKLKIILLLAAFTVVPVLLLGLIVFPRERDSIVALRLAQLNTIADLKKDKIETFFRERTADIMSVRNMEVVKDNLPLVVRYSDRRNNPWYAAAKKELDARIVPLQKNYGYLDVMLLDPLGNVVYESNPAYAHGPAVSLPELSANAGETDGVSFSDIYLDKKGRYVITGIALLTGPSQTVLGSVVFEIDMGPVYDFIRNTTGLGNTGEALIARKQGDEALFLSPLRDDPAAALRKQISLRGQKTFPAQKAVKGENGAGISLDYTDREVLAAWRNIPLLRWGLVTKIDTSEAFEPIAKLRKLLVTVELALLMLGIFAAIAVAKGVTGPILALQKGTEIIGRGNLDHRVATQADDEVGRLSRAFDAMTDNLRRAINDYKETSEALRLSEREFRSLFELSAVGEVQADAATGRILRANKRYCEITGYPEQELRAMTFADVVHPEDRERDMEGFRSVLRGETDTWEIEKRYLRKDGRTIWVNLSGTVIRDVAGKPLHTTAVIQDITDRREAEEALRKAKERFEILSETAARLLESDRPQEIVRSLCHNVMVHLDCHVFFNYLADEQEERLHLNAFAGIPAEAADRIEWLEYGRAVCGCAARDGVRIVCDNIQETPDPRTDMVKSFGITAFACHPLLSGGRVLGTLAFGSRSRMRFGDEDLSIMKTVADQVAIALERIRLLESERLRTGELEALNRDLEAFAYSVSHDLRTPLRSIDGFSLALLEDYADKLDANGKDYLERVRASTQRMGWLIDDILKLSRVTRAEVRRESVDLSTIARDILQRLSETNPERRVTGKVQEGLLANGDGRLLAVLLENLLGNAWKFTGRSAEARIEFGLLQREGGKVYFVRDNGEGFDMKYAGKLFQPFQRLHAADFPGTGIGLATAKKIIERHGGKVWIEGEVGQGTTVLFTLG
jgi:PAS domain S-box-containing protein